MDLLKIVKDIEDSFSILRLYILELHKENKKLKKQLKKLKDEIDMFNKSL